jgi:hypothetical protein
MQYFLLIVTNYNKKSESIHELDIEFGVDHDGKTLVTWRC